ncbi:MAG: hypothetical protein V4456_05060 [Bacteroidota bacterium]
MNARVAVLTLILFFLSNCTSITNKDKKVETDSLVVGNWTNCAREYTDGSTMMGNVCLKLLFNEDHSGVATGGDGSKEKFTWTINIDTLSFKNAANTKYQLYTDGLYKITEHPVKTGKEVIMYDIAHKVKYYLNR